MNMIKVYLDMDGTIADLYNEPNWLENLRTEKQGMFQTLRPMITETRLIELFPNDKYEVVILSMVPKGATKEYSEIVKQEKNAWIDKHFPSIKKRIYLKYGYNKNLKNSKNAILIDDNEQIRKCFKGLALNPSELF